MAPWMTMTVALLMIWFTAMEDYGVTSYKLSSSTAEELNFRRQLKQLRKPAVTTIQTKYGDWYDCVDFYEQPAFDHPLLKDRKYEFKMSSTEALESRVYTGTSGINPSDIWMNGKGCPPQTVPIRKIEKDDLVRANMAAKLAYNASTDANQDFRQFAILRTKEAKKYYGGGMITSVYNPQVLSNQYSSSRVKFQNGPDSIAVGWVVNPSLYRDGETRLFIYTTTKDSNCYNTYCPGFILLRSDIPLDLLLKPYSKVGGPIYEIKVFVRKDPANGNWFLNFGLDNKTIGTWPKRIFTALSDSANYADWGGEVYIPPGTRPPPMGAGHVPETHKLINDCYGFQVTLINAQNKVDYNPPSCSRFNSNSINYYLLDVGNHGEDFQRIILFGGNNYSNN